MTDSDRPVAPHDADTMPLLPEEAAAPAPAVVDDQPAQSTVPAESEPKGTDWWGEIRSILWLVLAVLAFHSFIAKPFYIPSESMMPGLLKGDRLVVSKYAYGWSWVSPSFHILPQMEGRLWGEMPEQGDVVIVTPPGGSSDYIKRVIGLPGDRLEMIRGRLFINRQPVQREIRPPQLVPIDPNIECPAQIESLVQRGPDGQDYCRLPIVRETLPNGRAYDTVDLGMTRADDFAPLIVPPNHVFLMGDNRDESADSRFSIADRGLGGPVPWENLGGRAEFITFSLDGTSEYWNPLSWFTAFRGGRAGNSLRPEQVAPPPQ